MEAEAFAIERLARAAQAPMSGKVTISVPPVLASNFFATTLRAFSQRHPGIQLAIASEAQRVSLGRREADLAVRLARPDEPRNVTRKLGAMPFALYASRDYAQAEQPAEWAFIAYEARLADMPHEQWLRAAAGERPIVCEVSDITTQLAVARTGVGVAGLPVFMGDADPALQRLPWSGEAFSRDIWLVVHDDLRHSPPIRAVIDFVVEVVGNTFKS
jgi:DNA-binding transcriptional LysR family regulator